MNKIIVDYIEDNREHLEGNLNRIPKILDIDEKLLLTGLKEKENKPLIEKARYLIFDNHPKSINKTYSEHAKGSMKLAINSLLACFIFIVHAIFPILFNETGTNLLKHNIKLSEFSNN